MIFFALLILPSLTGVCQEVIVDDPFASKPFRILITPENILQVLAGPFTIVRKPVPGRNPITPDTMVVYKSGCCEFEYLRMPGKTVFYDATILSSEITLSNGVVVGMSKNEFVKLFHIPASKNKGNVFVVDNTTGLCNHSFYFDEDRLVSILVDGCIE